MLTEFSIVNSPDQIITFLYAILLGGLLCVEYDWLRGWRRVFRPSAVSLFLQDLIYCASAAVVVFCFFLVRCDGQLRIYVLLAAGAGFGLVRTFLSAILLRGVVAICKGLRWIRRKALPPLYKIRDKSAVQIRRIMAKCKNILKRKKKPLENPQSVDV